MTGARLEVALPKEVRDLCVPRWWIAGVPGKRRTTWDVVAVRNVYP